jgi:hypothetical protein
MEIDNETMEPEGWAQLCDDVLQALIDITPVDTGFCQSNWEMDVEDDRATFTNDTEYASYLDEGWSSQAPRGMTGPVLAALPRMAARYR